MNYSGIMPFYSQDTMTPFHYALVFNWKTPCKENKKQIEMIKIFFNYGADKNCIRSGHGCTVPQEIVPTCNENLKALLK